MSQSFLSLSFLSIFAWQLDNWVMIQKSKTEWLKIVLRMDYKQISPFWAKICLV